MSNDRNRDDSQPDGGKSQDLDHLGARIDKYRHDHAEKPAKKDSAGQGLGMGMRLLSDLAAGLILGLLIGYWLDQWLGTKPWMLLVFLVVGLGAGILNVIRASEAESKRVKALREAEDKEAALAARLRASAPAEQQQGDADKE